MSRRLTKRFSEAHMARWERPYLVNGATRASLSARAYNRASRREARLMLRMDREQDDS